MRRELTFLALVGLLAASYDAYLNDELDQAAIVWNLANGSLHAREYPDDLYRVTHNLTVNARYEGQDQPVGSTLLAILATPLSFSLRALDAVIPLWLATSLFVLCVGWGAFRLPPPWQGTRWEQTVRWISVGAILWMLTEGFRGTSPDLTWFHPVAALQWTNLMLWLAGAALLCATLRLRSGLASTPLWLATVIGPWLFWGQGLKYHALTAFLVAAMIFLRTRPATPRRRFMDGACVGAAVWATPGFGFAVVIAVALFEAMAWLKPAAPRRQLRGLAYLALGLGLALLPWAAINWELTGSPIVPPEFVSAAQGADNSTGSGAAPSIAVRLVDQAQNALRWEGPVTQLGTIASILTTGHLVEAHPMGVLMTTPVLLAAVLCWRGNAPAEVQFARLFALVFTFVLAIPAARQGAGPDVRMFLPVVPALAVIANHNIPNFLAAAWGGRRTIWMTTFAVVLAGILLVGLVVRVLGFELGPTNALHLQRLLWAFLGLVALGAAFSLALALTSAKHDAVLPARVVGLAMAIPIFWSVIFLFATVSSLADPDRDVGEANFMVSGMNPLGEWIHAAFIHDPPLPIVYDLEGNLVFHPDYGLCVRDPSPCPQEVRDRMFRGTITIWMDPIETA